MAPHAIRDDIEKSILATSRNCVGPWGPIVKGRRNLQKRFLSTNNYGRLVNGRMSHAHALEAPLKTRA